MMATTKKKNSILEICSFKIIIINYDFTVLTITFFNLITLQCLSPVGVRYPFSLYCFIVKAGAGYRACASM